MDHVAGNRLRKQSAEQKRKQIEKSKLRFKKRLSEKSPVVREDIGKEADITQEKRLRKRAQKELESVRKKFEDTKRTIHEQNKRIRDLQRKIVQLGDERIISQQKLSKAKELEMELEEQANRLEMERKRRMEAEQLVERVTTQHSLKQKNGRRVDLANQVKQLKKSNHLLRKQLENHDLLTQDKYGNLEQELDDLRIEVSTYRNRDREMENEPGLIMKYMSHYFSTNNLPDLIKLLQSHITTENLHHYYHNGQNVFYPLMKRVSLLHFQNKKRNKQYKMRNNARDHLGYITYKNKKWTFVDMTDVNHPRNCDVLKNISGKTLIIDRPAKATLQNCGATITKLYAMEAPKDTQQNKKKPNSEGSNKDYSWFGNFKVLIIGSRFLNEYKRRLESHGCHVELHNPYEESYKILKGKLGRAEVILVCERHIPHSLWSYIDKKRPFVTVLKHDSRDLISTFTYLTLQRCGLI
ncbi:hypothetical protein CFK37_07045 [Virgibacillus phasianinus]|uniref:DUF2325 domain-containing protein n=1 Tax=Virgibacillus phasianinus TaxID=2017483 RepID=A0A220U1P2_9BACI|nr:hypothetical protein [Virgibacillus phasianinus]ASK61932.1 hypothetical protein CFK37_07045 [Virgibacillus phasianinus]